MDAGYQKLTDLEKAREIPPSQPLSIFKSVVTDRTSQSRSTGRVVAFGAFFVSVYIVAKLYSRNGPDVFNAVFQHDIHHNPRNVHEREQLFLSVPNTQSALEASRAYATHPHLAGSPEDLLDAKALLHLLQDEFRMPQPNRIPIYKAGSEESRNATLSLTERHGTNRPTAWIDTYYPVMDRGISQSLEILSEDGNSEWTARLEEDGDPGDADAHKYRLAVPPFHGYSADGDVTGRLIYANYGRKEDYEELVARGANLTGKIVIARYGGPGRGLKIKAAEELGAVGVILYSDTRDDGFVTTDNGYLPYPAGPARNPTAIERGSVQYNTIYPGDPTTPGYPAYEDADRINATNLPHIPSLPLSWGNAQRLLDEIGEIYSVDSKGKQVLSGKVSSKSVHIINRVDVKIVPIWNTMAAIPGHIKNEVVVMGCHRDAWVMGAADPTSGTVSLHEIIRGFGTLLRQGWRPLRTIVIASWDAEEQGLIGSTEWAEDFSFWISDNVVSYLNLDTSVSGSMFISGASPSLAHLIRGVAQEIPHPNVSGKSLWDARNDEGPFKGEQHATTFGAEYLRLHAAATKELKSSDTGVVTLGSGSDFTVFLQRIGVASTHIGFDPTASDAVYHMHSIYDSQVWQERYGDIGFHKNIAISKHLGITALRLADSIVLPLNTTQYALELEDYLARIEEIIPSATEATNISLSSLRKSIRRVQKASIALDKEKTEAEEDIKRLLALFCWRRRYSSTSGLFFTFMKRMFSIWPQTTDVRESAHCHHDADSWLQYLDEDVDSDEVEKAITNQMDGSLLLPFPIRRFIEAAKRVGRINKKLMKFERGFISEGGIKSREWYKHLGVAPGKWLGYGATTFPALTEAITLEGDDRLISYEIKRLEELMNQLAETIEP